MRLLLEADPGLDTKTLLSASRALHFVMSGVEVVRGCNRGLSSEVLLFLVTGSQFPQLLDDRRGRREVACSR